MYRTAAAGAKASVGPIAVADSERDPWAATLVDLRLDERLVGGVGRELEILLEVRHRAVVLAEAVVALANRIFCALASEGLARTAS